MERKLWGFFSSSQVVAIIGFITLAVAVPTGVWAVSFTYNVLYNPSNGQVEYIDGSRRLWVTDPVTGQAATPANFVRITSFCNGTSGLSYTLPTGKALIILAADFSYFGGTAGLDNFIYLLSLANGYIAGIESSDPVASKNVELGNGYYVRNGDGIDLRCSSLQGILSIEGYLVPSGAVPPVGAAGQSVASHIMKGGKRL